MSERARILVVEELLARVRSLLRIRRTEKELEATHLLVDTVLEHMYVLVAVLDPQFNFVRVNRAYAAADQREPDFFPGKNHFDLYPNAENQRIFQRVVDTGEPYYAHARAFEYAEHPERGVSYWDWSLVPIKNEHGPVNGLVLALANVTKQVHAQQALNERVKELDCLLKMSRLVEEPGISLPEILQGTVELLPPAWQYPEVACARIVLGDQTFETANYCEDAPWRQTADLLALGQREGVVEICYLEDRPERDQGPFGREECSLLDAVAERLGRIIERLRLQEQVQRHAAELEQRVAERTAELQASQAALLQAERLTIAGKLAASLTHEISNPLQSVIGCLGLAEEALAEGGDISQYIEVALPELRRVAQIVARLRNLGRPSSTPAAREPTDINALLEEVLILNRQEFQEQGIAIDWQADPDLPLLSLVPDQIRQVFLNIVLNAIDALRGGGRLAIHTSLTHEPKGLRISFADDGPGIPPDDLPHIFTPFYSTKPEGLGLGLSISQDIATQHGGYVEVRSQLGQGTQFAVWLPA
jgi:signal transduction histidine kinase